ncbi:MAG: multidrug transporter [Bacteroidia bacterium 43-41]|nr:MAG: multidrug transporter [Bacteroidia bacterium 43-41]
MNRNKFTGGVFVFLGACSFGVLSTIVKNAYEEGYTLGQITGSQAFLGMVILWVLYFLQKSFRGKENSESSPSRPTAWWKVSLAGLFTGLVGIFYYQCIKLLPASIAIILLMQYLWISILIEVVVFRKKPHRMQLISASIVLVGTVLAGGIFNEAITLNIKGIGFGLLAAFCYALFLIASGRVGNDLPVLKKGALMITGSCMVTWIIFPPLFLFDGLFFDGLYKWGLMLALLGTVIPPLFFSFGMPRTGVSLGAILSAAELPVAVVSSSLILREDVQALQWIGVFLILSAIVLTNIKFGKTIDKLK